ncbi:ABC transporter ATP-binding protein [Bosea sp. (in: a-proteobacteria)]|uniref:ABC transporter ATP-binding protein n=1 Tax=Bosea sp. (in: a-proteobacteria) TaxID=1871050 RepID=UPI002733B2DD|nr:ABC transporter ATP-binding protein [Bosea sp. (in: a-proteobacteria)]MDP3258850.1 ABC transporter ATP-binding protein [Bosea sp. (in: a-proteobacteria)]
MFTPLFRWLESRIDVFAPFDERETPPRGVWPFMWHHIKGVKGWLAVVMLTGLGFSGIEAAMYLMVGWFVDLLATQSPETIFRDHGWLLAGAAFLVVVVRPLVYFANHAIVDQVVVPQITNQIRWRNHVYTLGHALGYFQNDFAGRLSSRVIQAGQSIRGATIEVIDDLWYALIFASVAIGFFGATSLWLALPVLVWLAAYVVLLIYFVPRAKSRSEANSLGRSSTTGRIVDAYTNILTVKLFARADAERSAVRESLSRWNAAFLNLSRLITGVSVILQTMNSLLVVVTAWLSLWLWSHGAMTPGAVAASIGLVLRLVQMSSWLIHLVRGVFENIGSVQESMETIAKPHDLPDAADAVPLRVEQGGIRFDKLRFNYGKSGGLFEGLDLEIKPGEKIGLVGPSGAGKSTLVNLLLRLYPLEGGRILIDGQDIAHVTQDSLRAQIGMVTQDNSLLHRSIGDNIAYGRVGSTAEEIAQAARQASAHEFVLGLSDQDGRHGFDSRVGERGVKLSGGQRQRIAIARVLLKDAPILILDEATSALDSEVEAAIQEQLTTLMQGKTVIAIAHRLSTIAALDRLVVLDRGRIVDIGSHAELVARGGLYGRLWARQSGGFLAAADPETLPA